MGKKLPPLKQLSVDFLKKGKEKWKINTKIIKIGRRYEVQAHML